MGINVASWQIQGAPRFGLQIKASVSTADCGVCKAQKGIVTYSMGNSILPNAIPVATGEGSTAPQTFATGNRWWFPIDTAGAYTFRMNLTCSGCSNAAELSRLDVAITTQTAPWSTGGFYGGWPYQDDRNSDFFQNMPGGWGPMVSFSPTAVANDKYYLLVDIETTSRWSGVVYYFSKNGNASSWASLLSMNDPTVAACAQAGCDGIAVYSGPSSFPRAPRTSYTSGEFAMDSYTVSEGNWYMRPFVIKKPSVGSSAEYRFAVGYNQPPASAPGLLPNL